MLGIFVWSVAWPFILMIIILVVVFIATDREISQLRDRLKALEDRVGITKETKKKELYDKMGQLIRDARHGKDPE